MKEYDYVAPRISSEYFDCSLPMQMDTYGQCGFCGLAGKFGCMYCFSQYQKPTNPSSKRTIGQGILTKINVEEFKKTFLGLNSDNAFYEHFISKKQVLHWGSLCEPFCPFEKVFKRGLAVLDFLGEIKYPTIISTKGILPKERPWLEVFEKYKNNRNFAIQFSITGINEEKVKLIEQNAPSPKARFETMKVLSDMGYYLILRLRPFIIGFSDDDLETFLGMAKDCGAKAISLEFACVQNMVTEYLKGRYDTISKAVGYDFLDYYRALSPPRRGSYLRLNRLVKEPFVKFIYTFTRKNDMIFSVSDPDFKELNDTPICCGLPYEENYKKYKKFLIPEFLNYNKASFFYMLFKLAKAYMKGKKIAVKFSDLAGLDSVGFLTSRDGRFVNAFLGSVGSAGMEIKRQLNLLEHLQERWNNLKSQNNPYIYYDGAMKPIGKDEEGNLIYVFNPPDYIERWEEEGIL